MPAIQGQHDLVLNHDILGMLFDFLDDREEISILMRTCRFTHTTGIPVLLSLPILLGWRDPGNFASFSDFILADPAKRAAHVRHLAISGLHGLEGDTVERFIRVLQCVQNLAEINLTCMDHAMDTRFVAALAANRSIKRIDLSIAKSDTAVALHEWIAPVETAVISVVGDSDTGAERDQLDPRTDPTSLLRAFSQTLQSMSASAPFSFSSGLIFPCMKNLYVQTSDTVLIYEAMKAFPNLTHLSVASDYVFEEVEEMEEERAQNVLHSASLCWPSLEHVRGDLETVYSYALTCPIRHLSLYIAGWSTQNPEVPLLANLLQVAKPSRLDLEIKDDVEMSSFSMAALGVIQECLTELVIIYYAPGVEAAITSLINTCMITFPGLTALQDLTFRIQYSPPHQALPEVDSSTDLVGNDALEHFGTSLHGFARFLYFFDARAFASQIFQRVPTLRNMTVDISLNGRYTFQISGEGQELILIAEEQYED